MAVPASSDIHTPGCAPRVHARHAPGCAPRVLVCVTSHVHEYKTDGCNRKFRHPRSRQCTVGTFACTCVYIQQRWLQQTQAWHARSCAPRVH
eukprot:scaffold261655_cov27-Tisochrysis_lutea.AAC.2